MEEALAIELSTEVLQLATLLGISRKQLDSLWLKFVRTHGDQADHKLRSYLAGVEREMRDDPRLLRSLPPRPAKFDTRMLGPAEIQEAAEASGYTSNSYQAMPDEPEAVPESYQRQISQHARELFALGNVKVAQKNERSIAQQVRQAAAEARKQGRDVTPHLERIQAEVNAMRQAA